LTEMVSKLEQRCDELEAALNKEKARTNEKERGRRRESRRARSVPGRDPAVASREFRGLPSRVCEQDAAAAGFRIRLEVERGRCRQVEAELASCMAENRDLSVQVQELQSMVERNKAAPMEERHKSPVDSSPAAVVCSECKKLIGPPPFSEPYEHDLEELPRGTGKVVRLKNGGSAFGSRDSLYRIGLEPDDATPGREVCSAILAAGFQQVQSPDDKRRSTEFGGGSLLAELEEQYRKLVVRYETLIETKGGNANQQDCGKLSNGANRPQDLPLNSPDPTAGHFDNGPPEYKRLFREIFETLRRSADFPPQPTAADK
jgi:hypothetical protein